MRKLLEEIAEEFPEAAEQLENMEGFSKELNAASL